MAAIDDVLQRLQDDPDFREQLATDPAAALEGYPLSADDLSRLVDAVAADAAPDEQRPRRSAFFALVAKRAAEERGGPTPPSNLPDPTP
jgi:hypothetical protein